MDCENENKEANRLLDLFDQMLALALAELKWFEKNKAPQGDVNELLALAHDRQQVMAEIDAIIKGGRLGSNTSDDYGDLTQIVQRIMTIDNELEEKARGWMTDLKIKMREGRTALTASKAYGGAEPAAGAAFFDDTR